MRCDSREGQYSPVTMLADSLGDCTDGWVLIITGLARGFRRVRLGLRYGARREQA